MSLSIGATEGCGSNAPSQADGAIERGADVAVDAADATVPIADCAELACLGTAAGVIVPCKPDNTCTYQLETTSVTRCFTNGVTIEQTSINGTTSNPGGQIIMSVKKNGAACYSLEATYADAMQSALDIVYKDASGMPMVTVSGSNNTSTITVTCPGGVAMPVSNSGSCKTALNALGGFIPASSCTSGTVGPCVF